MDIFGQNLFLNRIGTQPTDTQIISMVRNLIPIVDTSLIFKALYTGLSSQFQNKSISSEQWIEIKAVFNTAIETKTNADGKRCKYVYTHSVDATVPFARVRFFADAYISWHESCEYGVYLACRVLDHLTEITFPTI